MTSAALIRSIPVSPQPQPPAPPWRPGPVLPPGALAIAALEPGGCRWPFGEVDEPAFRFCNAPSRRRSYCEAHRRLAHRGGAR